MLALFITSCLMIAAMPVWTAWQADRKAVLDRAMCRLDITRHQGLLLIEFWFEWWDWHACRICWFLGRHWYVARVGGFYPEGRQHV